MKQVISSAEVWDDVLEAIGLDRDKDEPLMKMVITLEVGKTVIVESVKHASREVDDGGY